MRKVFYNTLPTQVIFVRPDQANEIFIEAQKSGKKIVQKITKRGLIKVSVFEKSCYGEL